MFICTVYLYCFLWIFEYSLRQSERVIRQGEVGVTGTSRGRIVLPTSPRWVEGSIFRLLSWVDKSVWVNHLLTSSSSIDEFGEGRHVESKRYSSASWFRIYIYHSADRTLTADQLSYNSPCFSLSSAHVLHILRLNTRAQVPAYMAFPLAEQIHAPLGLRSRPFTITSFTMWILPRFLDLKL